MNLKDQFLIVQIKRGNIQSFETMFHRFYPVLCAYAARILKKEEIAEEVVQDVFYNIWKNREELGIMVNLSAYLYRAVYNNSMFYLRKTKKEIPLDEKWGISQPDPDKDVSEILNAEEINKIIEKTLKDLPVRTREIFTLNRFEGLKYKEIAAKLSISVKTVEASMGKALKAFRNSLADYRTQ
jgi:RNA polymerase sigma-70 factor (ECF subfamily)